MRILILPIIIILFILSGCTKQVQHSNMMMKKIGNGFGSSFYSTPKHMRHSSTSTKKYYQKKRIYTCSQLTKSRAYSLLRAGHTYLDKDGDGHPCEWGKRTTYRYYNTTKYRNNCSYVRGYYRRSGTYVRGHTRCR